MTNKLFVDTWGWLTIHDRGESQHQEIVDFYKSFRSQQGRIYTTDYVLDETFTLFFKRLNSYQAKYSFQNLLKAFDNKGFNLVWITPEKFTQTQALRIKFVDKPKISFTDLTSMIVMKELRIEKILTDDDHFIQVGMGFEKIP